MAVLKKNLTRQAGAGMPEAALIMILVSTISIVSLKQLGNFVPRTACAVRHMRAINIDQYWDSQTGTCWVYPQPQCMAGTICEQSSNGVFYFSSTLTPGEEAQEPTGGGIIAVGEESLSLD